MKLYSHLLHQQIIIVRLLSLLLLLLHLAPAAAQNPGENTPKIPDSLNVIFGPGRPIESPNFTGHVWVERMLTIEDEDQAVPIGNVTFPPKSRSNWHHHSAGQTLLILDGVGYYQQEGEAIQVLRKGDKVQCPPNVKHWHGAANSHWFVQLALTKEHPDGRVIWGETVTEEQYRAGILIENEQQHAATKVSIRYHHIAKISALNTMGELGALRPALSAALDAGLTVSECREVLIHLYAYTGFPRSIQGIKTLMGTVEERKAKGIKDIMGADTSAGSAGSAGAVNDEGAKYTRGKAILEELVGRKLEGRSDYGDFAPAIDVFLKEHLFADLFERDVLSYQDREITTISALVALGGVEPMLRGHLGIAMNIGVTNKQLSSLMATLETTLGEKKTREAKEVLAATLANRN